MDTKAWRRIASVVLVVACNGSGRGTNKAVVSSAPASASARASTPPVAGGPLPAPSNAPTFMEHMAPALASDGEAFYIDVPTLTPDAPPEVADGGGAAIVECPESISNRTPIATLERLARAGNACGKAALAMRLLEERPPADAFRRALRLAIEAQDAGAPVWECFLFDFARDDARFATCVQRQHESVLGRNRVLALLYVSGAGVPRDLDKAQAIVEKEASQDLGSGRIQGIIDDERRQPTNKRYVFCRDGAGTTVDYVSCEDERTARANWKSSALRGRLAEAAGPHRAVLERLSKAFRAFEKENAMQVYWHIDGTLRGSVSANSTHDWNQRFDALLEQVLIRRSLPSASDGDLESLRKRIDALDRQISSEKPRSGEFEASSFITAYRSAQRKYLALEKSFVAFAVLVLGPEQERSARTALRALRADTLAQWSWSAL
jgi:hypothetical protein